MTGFISDWEHFFELRCHSTAHPQARELAIPLKEEFINSKYDRDTKSLYECLEDFIEEKLKNV